MAPKSEAAIKAAAEKKKINDRKALAHPLRVRILALLQKSTLSPNKLASELDEPLGNVSYHVKTLLGFDAIKLVKTEPRRGAVEHFYTANGKVTGDGVTLSPAKAHLAAQAIREVLSMNDMEEGSADTAGRSDKERQELGTLASELAAA